MKLSWNKICIINLKKNIPIKVEKKKERTNKKLYEEILWLTGC